MRVVVDTNVIVSGLLSPSGHSGRIIELLLTGRVIPLFDDRMLHEYHEVVSRPRLRIDPVRVFTVLNRIEQRGVHVSAPPLAIEVPDPDDLAFVEVAVAGAAVAIITGNSRHFVSACEAASVPLLTPAEFIERWRSRDVNET